MGEDGSQRCTVGWWPGGDDEIGNELKKFLDDLAPHVRNLVAKNLKILIDKGPTALTVARNWEKVKGTRSGRLYELKVRAQPQSVRLLLCKRAPNHFVVVRGLLKKSGRLPKPDIDSADARCEKLMKEEL